VLRPEYNRTVRGSRGTARRPRTMRFARLPRAAASGEDQAQQRGHRDKAHRARLPYPPCARSSNVEKGWQPEARLHEPGMPAASACGTPSIVLSTKTGVERLLGANLGAAVPAPE